VIESIGMKPVRGDSPGSSRSSLSEILPEVIAAAAHGARRVRSWQIRDEITAHGSDGSRVHAGRYSCGPLRRHWTHNLPVMPHEPRAGMDDLRSTAL
jgi:hypothetical protein